MSRLAINSQTPILAYDHNLPMTSIESMLNLKANFVSSAQK